MCSLMKWPLYYETTSSTSRLGLRLYSCIRYGSITHVVRSTCKHSLFYFNLMD